MDIQPEEGSIFFFEISSLKMAGIFFQTDYI
jgi:hypothetical protein